MLKRTTSTYTGHSSDDNKTAEQKQLARIAKRRNTVKKNNRRELYSDVLQSLIDAQEQQMPRSEERCLKAAIRAIERLVESRPTLASAVAFVLRR